MENELQKYADPAMFKAEPMPEHALVAPEVHLLWMTPDPLGAAAAMQAMYTGAVKRSLSDVTHAERVALLGDMRQTALKAPFEAIKVHFLIEGVTRAFTHQLVRQRTAVYAQESLRFAVLGEKSILEEEYTGIPVGMPPSLRGGRPYHDMLNEALDMYPGMDITVARNKVILDARPVDRARWKWDEAIGALGSAYEYLINNEIPAEDARGLLPTNTLTRIHYVTDLRNLHMHAGLRLSTQAQFEWKAVWKGFIMAIREYNPFAAMMQSMNAFLTEGDIEIFDHVAMSDRWQYEAISEIFRPICYYTGKCEFMASTDRACTIRGRVEANHAIGRASDQWHNEHFEEDTQIQVQAINPIEWLDDPTAAR